MGRLGGIKVQAVGLTFHPVRFIGILKNGLLKSLHNWVIYISYVQQINQGELVTAKVTTD